MCWADATSKRSAQREFSTSRRRALGPPSGATRPEFDVTADVLDATSKRSAQRSARVSDVTESRVELSAAHLARLAANSTALLMCWADATSKKSAQREFSTSRSRALGRPSGATRREVDVTVDVLGRRDVEKVRSARVFDVTASRVELSTAHLARLAPNSTSLLMCWADATSKRAAHREFSTSRSRASSSRPPSGATRLEKGITRDVEKVGTWPAGRRATPYLSTFVSDFPGAASAFVSAGAGFVSATGADGSVTASLRGPSTTPGADCGGNDTAPLNRGSS